MPATAAADNDDDVVVVSIVAMVRASAAGDGRREWRSRWRHDVNSANAVAVTYIFLSWKCIQINDTRPSRSYRLL